MSHTRKTRSWTHLDCICCGKHKRAYFIWSADGKGGARQVGPSCSSCLLTAVAGLMSQEREAK